VTLTVSALAFLSGAPSSGEVTVTGQTTTATTTAPAVAAVVDAATELQNRALSPGSIFSIFGSNLALAVSVAGSIPLPTSMNGASVIVAGVSLPLFYVSPTQINVILPYNLSVNTTQQLIVQRSQSLSTPLSILIAAANPGIFTVSQSGSGQGVITHADSSLVSSSSPAIVGETVVIYCAGLGATLPAATAGSAASSSPLSYTMNAVSVTIGGIPATVPFAGLTPGFTGLYQVNVQVPNGVSASNSVAVVLTVAGQTSPAVTMAVQ